MGLMGNGCAERLAAVRIRVVRIVLVVTCLLLTDSVQCGRKRLSQFCKRFVKAIS